MKKILLLFALIMSVTLIVNAQTTNKPIQIIVNADDLTPEQLAKVKARQRVDEVSDQIETYGKYAGMGKEVGIAVSEGLGAVKDVTLEFADTNVGKLTMALIVWKVIGDDLKGIVFGVPLWLILTIVIIWSYRKTCIRRKYLVKKDGGWWIFGGVREYETRNAMYSDGGGAVIHLFALILLTAVMFGAVIF